jgi:uncharacterized membrane protein SpoIIM required for sporulation
MIINLSRFIEEESPYWSELEVFLERLEKDAGYSLDFEGVKRFHYLVQHVSADLAKVHTFAAEQELCTYLESLVARAYGQTQERSHPRHPFSPFKWFFHTFPRTFRQHIRAFWLSLIVTIIGIIFGALAVFFDPEAKEVIMPFPHLTIDPSERVEREEKRLSQSGDKDNDPLKGGKSTFSAYLMTHNIRVSIFVFALGITWGIGTLILLFYNGVILGAVAIDYIAAGEIEFLSGWLLPHGAIEIPAILIAGQAGLILAGALIGWGQKVTVKGRLRRVSGSLVTLIFALACMLIWAGFVEAFLSQYHEPLIPYPVKIAFGVAELGGLIIFLSWAGKERENLE